MKHGDTVKYSRPLNEGEAALRFVVVGLPEAGKPRVDIRLVCDLRIAPIETVNTDEVCAC